MASLPYSNRELDQAFKRADERADEFHNTLMQRMDVFESNTSTSLKSIEEQTKKTNGRVTNMEKFRSYIIGFCAAVTTLLLPVLFLFARYFLKI